MKGETNLNEIQNKEELESILTQISEFGITPSQLFVEAHPEKEKLTPNFLFPEKDVIFI